MADGVSEAVVYRVELAWDDFLTDMNRRYPREEWPADRLHARRNELLEAAEGAGGPGVPEIDAGRAAGEMRAEARAIGAVLAARRDEAMEEHREDLQHDMARVVMGEGAEPWMVTLTPEPGLKRWGVIPHPDTNLTILENWNYAARYALPHYLTPEERQELGVHVVDVVQRGDGFSVEVYEPFDAAEETPGRDGPDMDL